MKQLLQNINFFETNFQWDIALVLLRAVLVIRGFLYSRHMGGREPPRIRSLYCMYLENWRFFKTTIPYIHIHTTNQKFANFSLDICYKYMMTNEPVAH